MGAHPRRRAACPAFAAMIFCLCAVATASDSTPIQFNRDIRPVISERCYTCHGPDKSNRKTKMHFDTEEGAFTPLASGGIAVRGPVTLGRQGGMAGMTSELRPK